MADQNNNVIYNIKDYSLCNNNFIVAGKMAFSKNDLCNLLESQFEYYHYRIHKNTEYIFFGDLDKWEKSISEFIDFLRKFLKEYYNLKFDKRTFKYTQNDKNDNSYHYSIPKWHCKTEKLKEIHQNFKKWLPQELQKSIDTTIYSEHWFRCPNQYKGGDIKKEKGKHIIKEGNIIDFIVDYIPDKSIDINYNDYLGISKKKVNEKEENNNIMEIDIRNNNLTLNNYNTNNELSNILYKPNTCRMIFDECYKQERFENYDYWISVGMALKNSFPDENIALDLFNYFSSKGSNYKGFDDVNSKFVSFVKMKNGYTFATIYYYAMEDNKPKLIDIVSKDELELDEVNFCELIKVLAGNRFIYQNNGENYTLYCFNGRFFEKDTIPLKKFISYDLHEFMKKILVELYWKHPSFMKYKNKISKLRTSGYKTKLIETYKELGVDNSINFDSKWWLYAFNNKVYDLKTGEFRDLHYEDYISMTCGYDWIEPDINDVKCVEELITKIMPIEEERKLYLQLLATGLEGKCLEKFIVFNGNGRNGKGMLNDLFLEALGEYGMIGNNSILFEKSKTGANPEKAMIHKKRLVVFREPPEKKKFENSVVKELTGGGKISARGLYDTDTQKELNLTMIIECNKRPLFSEDPQEADRQRIIDIKFRSTFTLDNNELNNEEYVFKANPEFKTENFKIKYKYALLKILFNVHRDYYNNNSNLNIPESIKNRTNDYLEKSCGLLQWFKQHYDKNNNNYISLNDVYTEYKKSEYFKNLSRNDKLNKSDLVDYFKKNIFLKKYYKARHNNIRNVLIGWNKKEINEDE
jgi:phage/plasmid-associated DNA primase